jgi:hypothetical protein
LTLLTIAQNVAYETSGPDPATIAGNTNPDATSILRIINKVGVWLQRAYDWDILTKEHTFTSIANETQSGTGANLAVPADFDRFIPETCWDRSSNNLISGPISPVEWQGLKVQTYSSQNKKFRYRGGLFLTSPALAAGDTVAYEYVKKNWCDVAATGTEKAAFTIDTDIALIDEELITLGAKLGWLRDQDQPWAAALSEFDRHFDLLISNEAATAKVSVAADIFAQNTRHFEGSPKASRASYGGDF